MGCVSRITARSARGSATLIVMTTQGAKAIEQQRLRARPRPAYAVVAASAASASVLLMGWSRRTETDWVAYEGVGYALGVVGLGMMVALLAYPLRKRVQLLSRAGRIRAWFHVHMVLGIAGPTAILLHANFAPGSLNARIALASMLIVAGSGFVGRFMYTRIHYELQGRKATLEELRRDATFHRGGIGAALGDDAEVASRLDAFESWALRSSAGIGDGILRAVTLGARTRRVARDLRARLARSGGARSTLPPALQQYLRAVRRVAEYRVYERGFALWHALHIPLTVLLFVAAAVHVVAVHVY
jgi:hypothetical protein